MLQNSKPRSGGHIALFFSSKSEIEGFLSTTVTIFRSLAPACCLPSNLFVMFSLFPRIKITLVHIYIRGKKKSLSFVVINLKGGKSIDPFGLESAEGFFFSPPEVKLWSQVKQTFIHPVAPCCRIYPYKNVTKNLELGFFTDYLEKNSGAELPFTPYLLGMYVLFLNSRRRALSKCPAGTRWLLLFLPPLQKQAEANLVCPHFVSPHWLPLSTRKS